MAIKRWLGAFAPAPVGVNMREKLYGALGALVGLFCTEWVGHHALGNANPWFIAPMGASAVLLFAAPASPLAQPWSIMAGNLVSALIGVFCAQAIYDCLLYTSVQEAEIAVGVAHHAVAGVEPQVAPGLDLSLIHI